MENGKQTQDVWFISFLILKGLKIESYVVLPNRRVRCSFDISNDDWQKYKLEFNNSEIAKYKTTIEQIKDLCY